MADEVIELIDISFRHKIPNPKFTNPWKTRKGPWNFQDEFLTLESGKILRFSRAPTVLEKLPC